MLCLQRLSAESESEEGVMTAPLAISMANMSATTVLLALCQRNYSALEAILAHTTVLAALLSGKRHQMGMVSPRLPSRGFQSRALEELSACVDEACFAINPMTIFTPTGEDPPWYSTRRLPGAKSTSFLETFVLRATIQIMQCMLQQHLGEVGAQELGDLLGEWLASRYVTMHKGRLQCDFRSGSSRVPFADVLEESAEFQARK